MYCWCGDALSSADIEAVGISGGWKAGAVDGIALPAVAVTEGSVAANGA